MLIFCIDQSLNLHNHLIFIEKKLYFLIIFGLDVLLQNLGRPRWAAC